METQSRHIRLFVGIDFQRNEIVVGEPLMLPWLSDLAVAATRLVPSSDGESGLIF
jgi:hypothetical protein